MSRATVYVICEDQETVEKAKAHFGPQGITVTAYTPSQWRDGLEQPQFRSQMQAGTPALVVGQGSQDFSNVLPFPGSSVVVTETRVQTMDELESKAIESAIQQYRGNLTEAAKALGIGRATLYRKVKQYQIDPSQARRKKAA